MGGRATGPQVTERVIADLSLKSVQVALAQAEPERAKTKLEERLSWSRSYLKAVGAVDNPVKGLWDLTDVGWNVTPAELPALLRADRANYRKRRREKRATSNSGVKRLPSSDNERLQQIEEWIQWSRDEIAALTSRIADLEGERAR
jgi:restriction endonuclease Mrr